MIANISLSSEHLPPLKIYRVYNGEIFCKVIQDGNEITDRKMDGGLVRSGPSHPPYKAWKISTYMTTDEIDILDRYFQAQADINISSEIHLFDMFQSVSDSETKYHKRQIIAEHTDSRFFVKAPVHLVKLDDFKNYIDKSGYLVKFSAKEIIR